MHPIFQQIFNTVLPSVSSKETEDDIRDESDDSNFIDDSSQIGD